MNKQTYSRVYRKLFDWNVGHRKKLKKVKKIWSNGRKKSDSEMNVNGLSTKKSKLSNHL